MKVWNTADNKYVILLNSFELNWIDLNLSNNLENVFTNVIYVCKRQIIVISSS